MHCLGGFFFNTTNLKAMRLLTNYVIIYPSLELGVLFQPYILLTHFQTSSQSKIICDKTPGSMSTVKPSDLLFAVDHPRRGQWQPTLVLLPGKSHGRRSLIGCSPWGRWGSDTTEWIHFHFSLSCIGEGNGNPLQCSCLENPRDGGAW